MGEIGAEDIREVMGNPDAILEAFSYLLRSVAGDAVQAVAITLGMSGQDPTRIPGEFFVQAVLIESERVFQHITRERWIELYDSFFRIKNLAESDPQLMAEIQAHRAGVAERLGATAPATELRDPLEDLFDGKF